MYTETKKTLKKAFEVCGLLYSLGNKYNELIKKTTEIKTPTKEEVNYLNQTDLNKAIILELRNRYKKAAKSIGLDEKYGIALLEYIALMEELKDERI